MYEAIADSWLINHRVTRLLLEELSQEALEATLSTRGGRTVGQQFVHVYQVRRWKLEAADKARAAALPELSREDGHDRARILDALERSAEALAEVIRESAGADGRVRGFKRGAAAFTGYLIAHEAHHRGHALLTVKEAKIRRPERLKFGLWEWNKI